MTDGASTNGRLTINPAAVARNWRALAAKTGAECAAVVKADAYGCGIAHVAPALARAGCGIFCVATMREAVTLRALLPDVTIFVLNGAFEDAGVAIEARLVPFISSPEALEAWPEGAPFALNVDTGMNRLGLSVTDAKAVAAAGARRPVLIASHFACADVPDHLLNAVQEAAFREAAAAFEGVPASLANSAALLTRPDAHYALVRPGIAMYGAVAAATEPALEPVARLEARVVQVRAAARGDTVGYGAAKTLDRESRIAIAALGYADGYLRAAGSADGKAGAPAFVNGAAAQLLGRVSMDLIAVDVTDAPCARGDYIELFGANVPIDAVAAAAGTIGYELLTGLSRRAERHYGPL